MRSAFKNKKLRVIAGFIFLICYYTYESFLNKNKDDGGNSTLIQAIESQSSDTQVLGHGQIIKLLPDDTYGSKHQRLLIKVNNQSTILIAHNIDLAPRVEHPEKGELIYFFGEYEWNDKGGVVHWIHHDPNGRHVDGWLKYKDKIYQ